MAMSMNKVFLSGRIKGDPYEVPGRHRQFTRFLMVLPRERNRRGEPDTVLVEAAGLNGARIMQTLKDGAYVTVEGRLRTAVVAHGETRESTLLVRLENFSINLPPAPVEDEPQASEGSGRKRRRRRRGRGDKGRDDESQENGESSDEPKSEGESAGSGDEPAGEKPSEAAPEPAKAEDSAPDAPKEAAKAAAEEPKTEQPKPDAPPAMPDLKDVPDESLKSDMPF